MAALTPPVAALIVSFAVDVGRSSACNESLEHFS